jgi:hypothetical protein
MKKIVMLISLVLLAVSGVFAQVSLAGQTYYYKYVETVDPDTGVRKKDKVENMYLTFTQNSCYLSDEKGIAKPNRETKTDSFEGMYTIFTTDYDGPYKYQGEQNNLLVFIRSSSERGQTTFNGSTSSSTWKNQYYLYFSKDYKRVNWRVFDVGGSKWYSYLYIFERADPPQKVDPSKGPEAPKQLW